MKKTNLLLALIITATSGWAQLTLTVQVPQTGVLLKPQLWNAVIVNSYPGTKQVYLGLTLSNASTGDPVITAVTTQFSVAPGSFQVQESTVSPISYDYLNSDITDRDPEGYLPVGSYSACYTLFEANEGTGTPITEQCIPITVEPVSPPILNTPFNEDLLHNPFPQFTWIPPTPPQIFSNLNYDLVLVQVQEGQSTVDAIEQNIPLYSTNTADIFLNYPASATSLDTGKTYAWQITAKNNQEYAAQSDVWTFSIVDTGVVSRIPLSTYTKLKRTLDASMSVSVKDLLAYYENDAGDSSVPYTLYNIDQTTNNNGLTIIDSGRIHLLQGINLIDFSQDHLPSLDNGKQYLFQIYNSRNEYWSMKFIYYKTVEENKN